MSTIKISTPFNIDLDFELAEFHKRMLAYFIDLIILIVYSWGIREFLYSALGINFNESALGADILIVSIPMLLYPLICEVSFNGQSPGKKALGIRVMSIEGGEPHIGQYIMRWIFRVFEWPLVFGIVFPGFMILFQVISVLFFGVVVTIIIAITKNNQRLGDMAAGTVVINTRIKSSIHDTIFLEVSQKDYKVIYPDVMLLSDRDINTIKSILNNTNKKQGIEMAYRVAYKIQQALKINSSQEPIDFLEQLMADYNFIATKE
ncbi:MAG: RDD family protein [Sphingobacteriales bacterium]|nr:RDD family protein [Sphingobacteriales bacterium]